MPRLLALVAALAVLAPAAGAQPLGEMSAASDAVRVRVLASTTLRTVTLRAHDGPVALRADGRLVGTLAPGESVTMRALGDRVSVEGSGVDVLVGTLEAQGGYGALVGVESGRTRRRYPGLVRATLAGRRAAALQLVNTVPTEAYVAAVVAGEYPFPEIEGLKAQAVLARTYALERRGRLGDHDVLDTTMDQVYPGVDAATALTRRAADETRGEVLAYAGAIAEVYYSSSNGGFTADNDAVWGRSPLPYLRARRDPYDASPDSRWSARISASRLHAALSERYGGHVTGVEIAARSSDGRAHWIRLAGARTGRISGQDFRMITIRVFGGRVVRSTLFDLRRAGDEYVLDGRGWGHGVGLSQYGARAQARQGRSYRDILDFYFSGARLAQAGGVAASAGEAYAAPVGPAPLLDPTTPTDPEERAAMGLRTRPLPRHERDALTRGETPVAPPPATAEPPTTQIEDQLRAGGGWVRDDPAVAEGQTRPRRTAW